MMKKVIFSLILVGLILVSSTAAFAQSTLKYNTFSDGNVKFSYPSEIKFETSLSSVYTNDKNDKKHLGKIGKGKINDYDVYYSVSYLSYVGSIDEKSSYLKDTTLEKVFEALKSEGIDKDRTLKKYRNYILIAGDNNVTVQGRGIGRLSPSVGIYIPGKLEKGELNAEQKSLLKSLTVKLKSSFKVTSSEQPITEGKDLHSKVFNDGNITFEYPAYINFKVDSNPADKNENFTDYIGRDENFTVKIDVNYSTRVSHEVNESYKYTTLDYIYDRLKQVDFDFSEHGTFKKYENCIEEDYSGRFSIENILIGRGIGKVVPHVRIGIISKQEHGRLTEEQQRMLEDLTKRVRGSFKVISAVEPVNEMGK